MLIEKGKKYPNLKIATREGATFVQQGASFDIVVAMPSPTTAEIKAIAAGSALEYAVGVFQGTVWLAFDCGGGALSFDCPIDSRKITFEFFDGGDANFVRIILCDSRTGVVKNMRGIGIQPAFKYELITLLQTNAGVQFDAVVAELLNTLGFDTDYIFKNATLKYKL